MTDYFAILGMERRPWTCPETLKRSFHRLAAEIHPDAVLDREIADAIPVSFVELNRAYRVLKDPVLRLGHLLELEGQDLGSGGSGGGGIGELGGIFMEMGALGQETRKYLEKRFVVSGNLERALIVDEAQGLKRKWEKLQSEVEAQWTQMEACLRDLDGDWISHPDSETLRSLVVLRQRYAVLGKWREQIGETLFSLKLG
jgi:DnaJ-class molecular chaperone